MAYLNYNSTCTPLTNVFNVSDIAYNESMLDNENINRFKNYVKKYINAPIDAEVIINSGATESIANCVLWNKIRHPECCIAGTNLDHDAVRINCKNYNVQYKLLTKTIPKNCSMIMLTHVSGKTGEYLNINTFMQNFKQFTFIQHDDHSIDTYEYTASEQLHDKTEVRFIKPLVVVDATQSITKLPINMEQWGVDALFFSLHKIGGPMNLGVLVVKPNKHSPFVPLIGGNQQHHLRGGTLNTAAIVGSEIYFKNKLKVTKQRWTECVKYIKSNAIDVVVPKMQHLYNTILIHTSTCPLAMINELSSKGIYVGGISACALETLEEHPDDINYIRISYMNDEELTQETLKTIVEVIKEHSKDIVTP